MAHKRFPMKSEVVPVDQQKEKIHGGFPGANVTFGGDRESPGGDASKGVSTHEDAMRLHQEHGKGKNVIDSRMPNMTDGDDRMDCGGSGPY